MKDYTGIKKNLLTAKSYAFTINTKSSWVFKCDCGNEITKRIDKVLSKNPQFKSCGCLGRKIHLHKEQKTTTEDRLILFLFNRYKKGAKERNYIFDLSFEIFKSLVTNNCFYCGQIPCRKQYHQYDKDIFIYLNGIDRKHNSIGYIENNCLPCCTICNRAKSNISFESFIEYIKRLQSIPCKRAFYLT